MKNMYLILFLSIMFSNASALESSNEPLIVKVKFENKTNTDVKICFDAVIHLHNPKLFQKTIPQNRLVGRWNFQVKKETSTEIPVAFSFPSNLDSKKYNIKKYYWTMMINKVIVGKFYLKEGETSLRFLLEKGKDSETSTLQQLLLKEDLSIEEYFSLPIPRSMMKNALAIATLFQDIKI